VIRTAFDAERRPSGGAPIDVPSKSLQLTRREATVSYRHTEEERDSERKRNLTSLSAPHTVTGQILR
jgi:hypothetical protein